MPGRVAVPLSSLEKLANRCMVQAMKLENLIPKLARPAIYERRCEPFWDDAHISRGMLATHLDPETDAASRNPAFIDRSIAWISTLIPAESRMLDLGCGPGLYTGRFAERGFDVIGMDISPRSIAYAREHDSLSTYMLGNYLELAEAAAYDVVTLIWCDYGALIPDEREELLRRIRRALRPGGLVVLDAFTPAHIAGSTEWTSWNAEPSGGFWSAEPYICLSAEYIYEQAVTVTRYVVVQNDIVRAWNIWNTCFTPESLADELAAAGLTVQAFYGDVAGTPYESGSPTICAVARVPGGE